MADSGIEVSLDWKDFKKELDNFEKQMPGVARKLMASLNRAVIKQVKNEARSRGYKAHRPEPWGDAGFIKNVKQKTKKNYESRIFIHRDAFVYNFIEFGAYVPERTVITHRTSVNGVEYTQTQTLRGFSIQARPLLYPIADSFWKTSKGTAIMQAEFDKLFQKSQEK